MEPTDVKGPLVQFQAAQFSRDEMKRVMKMMNGELAESALPPDVLDSVFEMWWPKLEEQVAKELTRDNPGDGGTRRSERDLLEEVLALTRRLADRERRIELDHPVWDDLFRGIVELARITRARMPDDESINAVKRVVKPLEYIARREMRGGSRRSLRHIHLLLTELEEILASDLKAEPILEASSDESVS